MGTQIARGVYGSTVVEPSMKAQGKVWDQVSWIQVGLKVHFLRGVRCCVLRFCARVVCYLEAVVVVLHATDLVSSLESHKESQREHPTTYPMYLLHPHP